MKPVVMDSSAILAFVYNEPGAELALSILRSGRVVISSVNYAEVLWKLREKGVTSVKLADDFFEFGIGDLIDLVDFNPELAEGTAEFETAIDSLGLSLGDRACLALAKSLDAPAITADRRWAGVQGVSVKLIR